MKMVIEKSFRESPLMEKTYIEVNSKDFEIERDEFGQLMCENCGSILNEDDMPSTCPFCGSEDLVEETEHLNRECPFCGSEFDSWEDGYTYEGSDPLLEELKGELICSCCYETIKKGE